MESVKEKVLVTGGAGFIGHHLVEHLVKNTDYEISTIDKLTYAARGFERLRDIEVVQDKDLIGVGRIKLFTYDITTPISDGLIRELDDTNYILHLAAETHVDRSIEDPEPFVRTNVLGTMHMLNFARLCNNLKGFLYFSTDEVFGPAHGEKCYREWDRYDSTNPYAATKAGGEELTLAYANTYGVPAFVTHTMNCFGERQHPEKFIPKCLKKILRGERVTIHADESKKKSGSRFYIHCRNVADAVVFLMNNFINREKYNIVGEKEVSNLELAQAIAQILKKPLIYEMVDFHSSRPGHDLRYGLDGGRLANMGWSPPKTFEQSLKKTIKWMLDRPEWLEV